MNSRIRVNQSQDFSSRKRALHKNLVDMGFSREAINRAFKYSKQKESMDELLNCLVKSDEGWLHGFRTNSQNPSNCKICLEGIQEHANQQQQQQNANILNFSDSDDDSAGESSAENILSISPLKVPSQFGSDSISAFNNNASAINPFQSAIGAPSSSSFNHLRVSSLQQAIQSRSKRQSQHQNIDDEENNHRSALKKYCDVCSQVVPADQMRELPCKHIFCISCIENYISAAINQAKFFNIKCMNEACLFVFQDEYIRTLLDPSITEKFFRLKEIAQLNSDKCVVWCPNPTCSKYLRISEEMQATLCDFACTYCSQAICLKCKRKAHAKKCCFFKKNCEEELNEEYENWALGKPVQLCPSCSVRVEKTEGCNHMICSVCNYHWCWLCRQQIIYGHYLISNPFGCPGMSGQEFTRDNSPKWKIYLKRLLIILMIVLLFVIGLCVVYPIVFGFYLWTRFYDSKVSPCRMRLATENRAGYYICSCVYILFGVILFPIFMVLAIFPCLILFLVSSSWRSYVNSSFPFGQAIAFNIQNNLIQRLNQ